MIKRKTSFSLAAFVKIGALSAGTYALSAYFDLFEKFVEQTRLWERWEFDEIIPAMVVLVLSLSWYSWRLLQEFRQELVQRRQAEETLQQAAERLELLVNLARDIASRVELDALLQRIFQSLATVVPAADLGILYLYDPETRKLVARAWLGFNDQIASRFRLEPGESISGQVFQRGQPSLSRTRDEVPELQEEMSPENRVLLAQVFGAHAIQSNVCVPLCTYAGETIGTLSLSSTQTVLTEADLALLEGVAGQVAQAIAHAQLFSAQQEAHDELERRVEERTRDLQEKERRYEMAATAARVGVWDWNIATSEIYLDPNLKIMLGYADHEIRNHLDDWGQYVHPEDGEAREQINELMGRISELSLNLRPMILDDLGLLPALQWHFKRYTAQSGVEVNFEHYGIEKRFITEIETTVYRIVQEALTNVARHAGVQKVKVKVRVEQSSLRVQIEDQGKGFDLDAVLASASTSGLTGMHERAILLGGDLEIKSAVGAGVRLKAELPLEEDEAEL